MSDAGDSDFSIGDLTPIQAPDLPALPAIDSNDPTFQSPSLPAWGIQAPDISPNINISSDDSTYQTPSIMGGIDFSGGDLPTVGAGSIGARAPDIGPVSNINPADPAFAPPVLPPAPPVRRSHSGAILTDPSELPDSYRKSMTGRDWVNPTGLGLRGRDGAGNGGFGQSRSDGTWHGGADWVNTPGQTIVAPTGGTIGPVITYHGIKGVMIDIGGGAHVDTLYTTPTVKKGDKVSAGDPIGIAASLRPAYGDQMTNHTHVQIKIPALNTVVDPTGLIPH